MATIFPGVYVEEVSAQVRSIESVHTSITAFVGRALMGPVNTPTTVRNFIEFESIFGGLWIDSTVSYAVRDFFLNGGLEAVILRLQHFADNDSPVATGMDLDSLSPSDYIGDGSKTGIFLLKQADIFNLLCIPPPIHGGDTDPEVYSQAVSLCIEKRAMLIMDPPSGWGTPITGAITKAIDGAAAISFPALDTRNVALYFPLVKQIDLLRNGKEELFVPCGIIAGIMARIDSTVGVWKAPAGSNAVMKGISGFQVVVNDRDNGLLNNSGINCLRNLRAHGHVIWGARTFRVSLQVNDEFKYIPVRRTALFIEESIYRGIQWAVFESNDELLWTRLRLSIESFMHNLYRQGAFPGSTPKEAYFIRCGNDTISQNDITQGKLNIIVGFAPLKPAEFVLIHFHLQVQFA